MKNTSKSILGILVVVGLGFGPMTGCVGGYVEAGEPVYYGGDPWVRTDVVVVGGGGWYGEHRDNAYVHPDSRRNDSHAVRQDNHPAPRKAESDKKSDDHHK